MKYSVTLVIVFLGFILYAGTQIPTGITGRTEKNGFGCNCHSPDRDMSVVVQIQGPDTLVRGQTGQYSLTLSGGPAVQGGFNVASHRGNLNVVDGTAQVLLSELTHTSPKSFSGSSSINWQFTLTARDSVYTDTIYSVANSVNGDGEANSSDRWNYGNKFVVHVINQPSSIDGETGIVNDFVLDQNFPNPFNTSTVIQFNLPENGYVTLKVYDSNGKEIAELLNEYRNSGVNDIKFNAEGLSSGVYFYSVQFNNHTQTKKMLLLR